MLQAHGITHGGLYTHLAGLPLPEPMTETMRKEFNDLDGGFFGRLDLFHVDILSTRA